MRSPVRSILILVFVITHSMSQAQTTPEYPWYDSSLTFEERADALVNAMTLEEKIAQSMDQSPAIDRLGIPEYNWWNEALHGVARNGRATVFPQAIALAATFDPELIFRVSSAISTEARAKFNASVKIGNRRRYAGLTFWSPNVNIFRDPRWGRGQETYGEDPFLSATIGTAFVEGMQGDDPKYLKTAACAKHYLVHSGPEALRHEFDAIVSDKDLQETYLPAFEELIKQGNVEGVMGAYNRVNGKPASGSQRWLQKQLREEWQFDGYIVSDCGAIADFHNYHGATADAAESSALAINSGLNLNCGDSFEYLAEAIDRGLLKEETLDASLKQLLLTRFKLGLFDDVDDHEYNTIKPEVVDSDEHRQLAYEAAVKSIVLLKNESDLLPLSSDVNSLYIVGPHASSEEVLLGNYYGLSGNTATIVDGITSRVGAGVTINYKYGVLPYRDNVNPIDWSTGEAKDSDVMIAVMGISNLYEGEEGESLASSTKGDKEDIKLPQNQIDYFKKLKGDSETPLILILTGGSPIAIPEIEPLADAILFAWYPGEEGGNAVADLIFGNRNPSGRLPVTFPYSVNDLPPFEDYSMKGRTYKYMQVKPQFPFGYGLSYTTFEYSEASFAKGEDKAYTASVTITNNGDQIGEEVVQLYVSSPAAGQGDPISSLIGIKRVEIGPGKSMDISFQLDKTDFYMVDDNGDRVTRKGNYKLWIGNSSPGERSKELGGRWEVITVSDRMIK